MEEKEDQPQSAQWENLPADEQAARIDVAIAWIRVWMRALPAPVCRALEKSEVATLRWILQRVMNGEKVDPSTIPLPKSMHPHPFWDVED
jgi:hypothetical protein